MAEEDERFGGRGGRRRQPDAGEELHAPRVPHVLLRARHPCMHQNKNQNQNQMTIRDRLIDEAIKDRTSKLRTTTTS